MKSLLLIILTALCVWLASPILPMPPTGQDSQSENITSTVNMSTIISDLGDKVSDAADWVSGTSKSEIDRRVSALYDETNAVRKEYGLPVFLKDPQLKRFAQGHAKSMHERSICDHKSFDNRAAMSRFSYFAENCAGGGYEASSFIKMWMNSPGHRANILNPNLKYLGIGVYGKYAVQDFGGE